MKSTKNSFDLETPLREMMHACTADVHAPDTMKTRIDAEIRTVQRPRQRYRKLVIGAAAAVSLTLMGALASGQIVGLVSATKSSDVRTEITALQKDTNKVFQDVTLPDTLAGYDFLEGALSYTDKLGENGNRFGRYPSADASYTKGNSRLSLSVHSWDASLDAVDEKQPDVIREIKGVAVAYRADRYLFLPEGIQPTADEQARMDAGELYISAGSSQREQETYQHVSFRSGDMVYSIQTFAVVTEDVLFDAAADLLANIR